ncbi:MAG: hypothetical protein JKP95_04050 [Oceanicaulis sp.]|nr:hypothetical protein [Oceanicaulis sp.]
MAAAQSRILSPVLFDIPDMAEPPSGVIYSLPHAGRPLVNDIHLVAGSMPDPARRDQVVVLEGFATAHGLTVGDTVTVTIRAGENDFRSLESPSRLNTSTPSPPARSCLIRHCLAFYGWTARRWRPPLISKAPLMRWWCVCHAADPAPVRAAIDRILEPYAGAGAYTRREHVSAAFLQSELDQLQTMGAILPPIFLARGVPGEHRDLAADRGGT